MATINDSPQQCPQIRRRRGRNAASALIPISLKLRSLVEAQLALGNNRQRRRRIAPFSGSFNCWCRSQVGVAECLGKVCAFGPVVLQLQADGKLMIAAVCGFDRLAIGNLAVADQVQVSFA